MAKLSELTEAEELLSVKEKHLQEVDRELQKIKREAQRYVKVSPMVNIYVSFNCFLGHWVNHYQ